MRSKGKLAKDGTSLQNFFVELFVLFRVTNVNARAQHADRPAV